MAGRSVDVGLLAEALIYYESVLVNVSSQPQLAELLQWFADRGLYDNFLSLVGEGTVTFYDYSFVTSAVRVKGKYDKYDILNLQDPIQAQPDTFERRFLYHPNVARILPNARARRRLYDAVRGHVIEAKANAFGEAVENASADFADPRRTEAYRVSRRPHFLGGWGLWDVRVGFHRRCVSAPFGW